MRRLLLIINGLQESLKDMKLGEKRLPVIPPELGFDLTNAYYGKEIPDQKSFVISPGEILILEVTLNKIYSTVR
jgi:FKBP-type peptidyl-prolyl cis-trans isomerase